MLTYWERADSNTSVYCMATVTLIGQNSCYRQAIMQRLYKMLFLITCIATTDIDSHISLLLHNPHRPGALRVQHISKLSWAKSFFCQIWQVVTSVDAVHAGLSLSTGRRKFVRMCGKQRWKEIIMQSPHQKIGVVKKVKDPIRVALSRGDELINQDEYMNAKKGNYSP